TDTRARVLLEKIRSMNCNIEDLTLTDVYTLYDNFSEGEITDIAKLLSNPITQTYNIDTPTKPDFNWAIEIGFLPGVTDNIATTARECIEDFLKQKLGKDSVFTSQILFLKTEEQNPKTIGKSLANELIQRIDVKSFENYQKENGMDYKVSIVKLKPEILIDTVSLDTDDKTLSRLGKEGIPNSDGTARGPLALDLEYMKTIKEYFSKEGRDPTDIELESIAQTWSEHCKHTIFASELDEIKDGIYKTYIKSATEKIKERLGKDDFCVSVFKDNSGAIIFDDNHLVTAKVETHNSPSALDPFGGAITGIVGVNRDTMGFGMGAIPAINFYGYCFANPFKKRELYRQKDRRSKALSPRRIMDGVIEGVRVGGNCSGIPTPQGFVYFDDDFSGKPLVFVGTFGIIPKIVNEKRSDQKKAQPGDFIVMMGGKVGCDGIHGATFSSEAMDSGSPATAVQIGDPITQKKMSDALIKEARDLNLYTSITDNGAGGISCSVAEMAEECGGFTVNIEKVPTKYAGIQPWEIWISESQERMTLSVPKEKIDKLKSLMDARGVGMTAIGEFNDSSRAVVKYQEKTILDIDMKFLHKGLPEKTLKTEMIENQNIEPEFKAPENLSRILKEMIQRINLCNFSFISSQYDHEVQGGSVLKPLQGEGKVNAAATVTKLINNSDKGIVLSQGITAKYSRIDTYHMAACAIDTAVRNAVSAGGNIDRMALMDNFCWCSSNDPKRLYQLKKAAKACYDYATAYMTPFISGKDSMFNDFKGYDENNSPVLISVPPTLLITATGVIDNVNNTTSLDPKAPGDLIYIIGTTRDELGGSEYYEYQGEIIEGKPFTGASVPKVDAEKAIESYRKLHSAIKDNLIASSISVSSGGIGIALAKMCIAGNLGCMIDLSRLKKEGTERDDFALFSESQSRIIVTIDPKNKEIFENLMNGTDISLIGAVTDDSTLKIKSIKGNATIECPVDDLKDAYNDTFKRF
ncbi:MAG: AIR synthase-related protein, partial [archaeon]|nr:AIR synthase-related protein [archaeon]